MQTNRLFAAPTDKGRDEDDTLGLSRRLFQDEPWKLTLVSHTIAEGADVLVDIVDDADDPAWSGMSQRAGAG